MQAFAFWNLYRMLLRSGREREFPAEVKELRRTLQESRRYLLGGRASATHYVPALPDVRSAGNVD